MSNGAPDQLDLLGGIADAKPRHRLFLALLPDEATRGAFVRTASSLKSLQAALPARWVEPSRYHATLHFLGDHAALRDDLVAAIRAAVDAVSMAPFVWTLDQAGSFRGHEPPLILLGTATPEPLQQLWQRLQRALVLAGLGKSLERRFTPHVTLAYARDALPATAIAPIEWHIDGFALLHSVLGQGDGYEVLGRWAFNDG